jgi:hypothetical protein
VLNYHSKLTIAFRKLDVTSVVLRAIIAVTYHNKYKLAASKALIEFPVIALSDAVSYYTTRANAVHRVVQHYYVPSSDLLFCGYEVIMV